MQYGRGFQPDALGAHDGSARSYLASAPSRGQPVQWLDAVGVGNQLQTETCVGFAMTRGIAYGAAALGLPPLVGSEAAVVAGARMLADPNAPVVDAGCQPFLAAQFIRRYGLPTQDSWPFDPSTVARPLTLAELCTGDKSLPLLLDAFLEVEADVDLLRQALDAGHAVFYAVASSTEAFEGAKPGDLIDATPVRRTTDHAGLLIGYDSVGFIHQNSWGKAWGYAGTIHVTPDFVMQGDNFRIIRLKVPT